MNMKLFVPIATVALASLGIGSAQGQPPGGLAIVGSPADHGDASTGFAAAHPVDTLRLTRGNWKITATGAVTLAGDPIAQNCGLRVDDNEAPSGYTMLAKQNPAVGSEEGRVGFSVVGALSVDHGPVDVDLVCYPQEPFEHNIVAVGGRGGASN